MLAFGGPARSLKSAFATRCTNAWASSFGSTNWKGPCRLERSPHPAIALEAKIAEKIAVPTAVENTREIAFIEVPLSAADDPRALPKAQRHSGNWQGSRTFHEIFRGQNLWAAAELSQEPRPRRFPVPHHGIGGDFHHLGGFFYAQPAEKAQFDDPRFARVHFGQSRERIVQSYQLSRFCLRNVQWLDEVEELGFSAAFVGQAPARAIEQNPA